MQGYVDGVWYKDTSQAPDLGSLRLVRNEGMIRHYNGLSADASKMPTYVRTGSTVMMLDTGEMYFFEETTKTWYKP